MKRVLTILIALSVVVMGFAIGKKLAVRQETGFKAGKCIVANASKADLGNLKKCGEMNLENGIGTGYAGTLSGAALFTSSELTEYVGQFVSAMQIGIADASVVVSGKIMIMTGNIETFDTVYQQNVEGFEQGVNEFFLHVPYQIPANIDVALAYEITVNSGYAMGVDNDPAVENGDLVSINGGAWMSLVGANADLNCNPIISATVEAQVAEYLQTNQSNLAFESRVGEVAESQTFTIYSNLTDGMVTVSVPENSPFLIACENAEQQPEQPTQLTAPVITTTNSTNTFEESIVVTITAEEGATIHYTLDGNTPTNESAVYSSAITLEGTTTVKAIAVREGYLDSEVASATFTKIESVELDFGTSIPESAEAGSPVEAVLNLTAGDYIDSLCMVKYEIKKDGQAYTLVEGDALGYSVRLAQTQQFNGELTEAAGTIAPSVTYGNQEFGFNAFTLGMFESSACMNRDRPITLNATFANPGVYSLEFSIYTAIATEENIDTVFNATDCNNVVHYDCVATAAEQGNLVKTQTRSITITATVPEIDLGEIPTTAEPEEEVTATINLSAEDYIDSLCMIVYEIKKNDEPYTLVEGDELGYSVRLAQAQVFDGVLNTASGILAPSVEYGTQTFSFNAFTLGMFENSECVNRQRPITLSATFANEGVYTIIFKIYTARVASEEQVSEVHTFTDCHGVSHSDLIATGATQGNIVKTQTATLTVANASAKRLANREVTNWAKTLTISAANLPAIVEVKYVTPETESHDTVQLTITADNNQELAANVMLTGVTYDCTAIGTVPYSESFETGIPPCWTIIDVNGDGKTWSWVSAANYDNFMEGQEGAVMVTSYINNVGAHQADEYLISNAIAIPAEGAYLSFYTKSLDADYPEEFNVYVATDPENIEAYTEIIPATSTEADWTLYEKIIPSSFNEQTVYVIFHMAGYDNFAMLLDDVRLEAIPTEIEASLTIETPNSQSIILANQEFVIGGEIENRGGITITSYTVSYQLDGGEAVVNQVSGVELLFTEVAEYEFAPISVEPGSHTIVVTLSNVNGDEEFVPVTAEYTFEALDCSPVTELPYSETLLEGLPECWFVVDNNNDGITWTFDEEVGLAYIYSSTENADDYLMSKGIDLAQGNYVVSFDYVTSTSYGTTESMKVFVGNAPTVAAMTTEIANFDVIDNDEVMRANISFSIENDGVYYIGIKATSAADMFYLAVSNFEVKTPPTTPEITLTSVSLVEGSVIIENTELTISGVVTNNGTTLTGYTVEYKIDDAEPVSQAVSNINVASFATHTFTFAPITLAVGDHTIVVTISNPNGTADNVADNSKTTRISVVAAPNCDEAITAFPYLEDFENSVSLECWTFIDADGDGNNWYHAYQAQGIVGYNGSEGLLQSASYSNETYEALTPDNWAITPALAIPANSTADLDFYIGGQDADFAEEHYGVYVSTTTTEPGAFTLLFEETMNAQGGAKAQGVFGHKEISLNDYAGQTIYIGFRHFNCSDMFLLNLDQVQVTVTPGDGIESEIANAISVYPNPASNIVTIANAEGQNVVIVNSLGQVVVNVENASANHTIDLGNFANGTYFVKVGAEVVKLNVVK